MARLSSRTNFPATRRLIEHDLPKVVYDSAKYSAFKQFGQFTDQAAREVLCQGSGPFFIDYGYRKSEQIHGERVKSSKNPGPENAYIRLNRVILAPVRNHAQLSSTPEKSPALVWLLVSSRNLGALA